MIRGVIEAFLQAARESEPVLLVLAGPNGSGKSTFFELFVAALGLPFVNADRIAASLEPTERIVAGDPDYQAARIADAERHLLLAEGKSFCMETVFSDTAGEKRKFLRAAQKAGYMVILVFFGLSGPDLSIARVVQRVAAGGHDVPDEKLRQRFPRTLDNLRQALRFVDYAFLFDNSSSREPYRPVAVWRSGKPERTFPPLPDWAMIVSSKKPVLQ